MGSRSGSVIEWLDASLRVMHEKINEYIDAVVR
jgi:hypothetical protein